MEPGGYAQNGKSNILMTHFKLPMIQPLEFFLLNFISRSTFDFSSFSVLIKQQDALKMSEFFKDGGGISIRWRVAIKQTCFEAMGEISFFDVFGVIRAAFHAFFHARVKKDVIGAIV